MTTASISVFTNSLTEVDTFFGWSWICTSLMPAGSPALLPALLIFALGWEFAFRGFVQPRLAARLGERWGWLAASGLAALTVLPFRIMVAQAAWPLILGDLALELVKSLLAGWMVQKNGGDVLSVALYRAIHDWTFFL